MMEEMNENEVKLGYDDLKELIDLGLHLGMGFARATEDGKWTFSDTFHFVPAVTKIPKAVDGIQDAVPQLLDLDEQELAGLHEHVKAEFDIPDDKLEQAIEKGLLLGLTIVQGGKEIYDLLK